MTTGTPPADGPEPQDPPDGEHPSFDTSVAHVARIYDYWLGGKDNYAVDRAAGDAALKAYPDLIHSVRRAARRAVGRGGPQAVIGPGLPLPRD